MRLLSDFSRYDWTALALAFIGSGASGVLTLVLTPQSSVNVWAVALVVIIPCATAGSVAVSLLAGNRKRSAEERETRRQLARFLIEDYLEIVVKDLSERPESTGATVYFPGEDGRLHPIYQHNKKGKPDENLAFAPLEGATGHAWSRGEQAAANWEDTTDEVLRLMWKLTPEMVKLTEHLTAAVSTPMFSRDRARVIGVVTVDCEAPNSTSGVLSEDSTGRALQHVQHLAGILELGNLV